MLGKLFGKVSVLKLPAPVEGEVVPITQVNDPTFSEGILGKGIAIKPSAGRVVSPADGKVSNMFETGHAVTLVTEGGIELLIHVGLDTVSLKGRHYTIHAHTGDTVKAGDLLIEFDKDNIREEGFDLITPVVICNSDDFKSIEMLDVHYVKELDEVIEIKK